MTQIPWLRLALAMGFVYAALSVSQYHSVLFQYTHAMNQTQIGLALALGALAALAGPLALQSLRRLRLNDSQILAVVMLIQALLLWLLPRWIGLLPATLLYIIYALSSTMGISLVASSVLQSMEQLHPEGILNDSGATRAQVKPQGEGRFLGLRALGTAAFAAGCGAGWYLAKDSGLRDVYWFFVATAVGAALVALSLPYQKRPLRDIQGETAVTQIGNDRASTGRTRVAPQIKSPTAPVPQAISAEIRTWLWKLAPLITLLAIANMAASSGALYLGNLVRTEFAGNDSQVSLAWLIGTATEVPLILASIWLLRRARLAWMFAAGMAFTAFKLLGSAWAPSIEWLYFFQIGHGFFFGASLTAVPLLLRRIAPTHLIAPLLMWCTALYGGLASALGSWTTGWLWETFGLIPSFAFWGVISLGAALWILMWKGWSTLEAPIHGLPQNSIVPQPPMTASTPPSP
jgi:hypothetical protein